MTRRNSIVNVKIQNRLNKQKKRDRQNEFSQSFNESNVFFFQQYQFVDYYVFNQKQIYQKQFDQLNQRRIQNVLSSTKQFFLFIFENAFDSKNQTRQTNEKFDERDEKSFKRKTYVLNEFEKKKSKTR